MRVFKGVLNRQLMEKGRYGLCGESIAMHHISTVCYIRISNWESVNNNQSKSKFVNIHNMYVCMYVCEYSIYLLLVAPANRGPYVESLLQRWNDHLFIFKLLATLAKIAIFCICLMYLTKKRRSILRKYVGREKAK